MLDMHKTNAKTAKERDLSIRWVVGEFLFALMIRRCVHLLALQHVIKALHTLVLLLQRVDSTGRVTMIMVEIDILLCLP